MIIPKYQAKTKLKITRVKTLIQNPELVLSLILLILVFKTTVVIKIAIIVKITGIKTKNVSLIKILLKVIA